MANLTPHMDLWTVALWVPLAFITYAIVSAVYNVYFHPLRKYPGPLLWRASLLPQILVRVAGKRAFKLLELHKKYGDIVRTGPDQISFIHPNAWKQIYSFDHGKYTFKKHFRQYASFEDSHNILDAPGPAQHPRVRRALLPAFTDRSIKTLEPYFHKNVDRLVQYLSGTQQADMKNAYTFTTTDIVTDIASLDRPYLLDTLDSSQVMFATSLEYWIVQVITVLRHFPTAHYFFVRFILTPLILHLQRGKLAQDSYEKLDNDREDLWSLAQKNEDGNVRLSLEEIKGNGEILTIAGAETTSTALTALTWHALKTPETVKKLANEIRAAFTSPDDITFESIRDLPYLNACIKEALRIWPPVGGSMLRITPPQGGTICGEYLPGGVEISIPQYASGHLPAYWQDPEAFIPERWIDPKNTRFASDRREASNPFALGPQSCIGERLAWHQGRLILAKVLWHFDLILCDATLNWRDQKEFAAVWRTNPVMVDVQKRV